MPSPSNRVWNKRLELLAFLGGLGLFLAAVEYLFPRPLPFFRLGLANLPLLLALGRFHFKELFLLTTLKVVGQGLINGTLASYVFLFSAIGSFASLFLMVGAHRLAGRHVSLVGLSLLGALGSNVAQVFLSINFLFGSSAWIITPLFIGLGTFSGFFIGLFAQNFSQKSLWWARICNGLED